MVSRAGLQSIDLLLGLYCDIVDNRCTLSAFRKFAHEHERREAEPESETTEDVSQQIDEVADGLEFRQNVRINGDVEFEADCWPIHRGHDSRHVIGMMAIGTSTDI